MTGNDDFKDVYFTGFDFGSRDFLHILAVFTYL